MSFKPLSLLFVTATALAALAQSADRVAITADDVARALAASGIAIAANHISLPPRLVAAEPAPALTVLSIEPLSQKPLAQRSHEPARVKLTCQLPSQCLPFYALVTWPEKTQLVLPSAPALIARKDVTIRAGARAILIMDDHRSHIQVAVISLENGTTGQRIRVTSADHKQFYVGEVINAGLLRGSF